MSQFDKLIDRVLSHEGWYSNDPQDPGGETQWGISKRAHPDVNIKALTRAQAIDIYRADYWDKIKGDQLPAGIAFQVLDAAVNHGVRTASRWLQASVGVTADGIIGPATLAAVRRVDAAETVLLFNATRLEFYTDVTTFARFGRGWTRRVAGNLRYAVEDLR